MKSFTITFIVAVGFFFSNQEAWGRVYDTRPSNKKNQQIAPRLPEPANKKLTQQERIDRGFKNGQLTKAEYDRLNAEQELIRNYRANLKEDGVSEEERKIIDLMRSEQNNDIATERQDSEVNIKKMKKSFKNRIKHGNQNGQLTQGERKELKDSQAEINEFQEKAAADGKIDWKERAELVRLLQGQSKAIYEEKHDTEAKPGVAVRMPAVNIQLPPPPRQSDRQFQQGSLDDLVTLNPLLQKSKPGPQYGYAEADDDYSNLTPDEIAELKTLRAKQRARAEGSSGRQRQEDNRGRREESRNLASEE